MLDARYRSDVQRPAFAHRNTTIRLWMLSFCFADSWTLFFLDNFVSIVLFLLFLILYGTSKQ
jgi:hypothetical protein